MEEILTDIIRAISPIAILILLSLGSWILILLKNKIKNAEVKSALDVLRTTADSVVNSLNRTDVAGMKTESGSAELSMAQAKTIKQKAKDMIVAEMPDAVYTTLEKANVDIESRLNSEIENQVGRAKQTIACLKDGEI
jgi:hypothetical protein